MDIREIRLLEGFPVPSLGIKILTLLRKNGFVKPYIHGGYLRDHYARSIGKPIKHKDIDIEAGYPENFISVKSNAYIANQLKLLLQKAFTVSEDCIVCNVRDTFIFPGDVENPIKIGSAAIVILGEEELSLCVKTWGISDIFDLARAADASMCGLAMDSESRVAADQFCLQDISQELYRPTLYGISQRNSYPELIDQRFAHLKEKFPNLQRL